MYKSSENHISQGKWDLKLKSDAVIAKFLVFLTDERIKWLLPLLPYLDCILPPQFSVCYLNDVHFSVVLIVLCCQFNVLSDVNISQMCR